MSLVSPILTPKQIEHLSGGYKRPAQQLRELLRRGFWRATRSPLSGRVLLEVAHYEAVCAAAKPAAQQAAPRLNEPRFSA